MTAWFFDSFGMHGSRPALVCEDGAVDYAMLAARADAFAARLGPVPQLVLLSMTSTVDAVVAYLGCLRGRHPVILAGSADLPATRALAARFLPDIECDGTTILGERALDSAHRLHPDLAVLLSTSGSTGGARLVRLAAAAVDANARTIAAYLDIDGDERGLASLPLHYSYGLSVLNSHLAAGAAVVLSGRSLVDPELWALARASGATSLAGVPHSYELLETIGFRDDPPPALRTLTQAGGRLAPALARTYHAWAAATGRRFVVMYGQTEATARIACASPADLAAHPGCIGRAVPGGSLELRPVADQPRGTGELVYRGPNVMMGYASGRDDLARGAEVEALATGDLAVEAAPGVFRIVGRLARFAKIAGLRIGFDDVEAMLGEHGIVARVTGDDGLVAVAVTADAERAAALIAARTALPAGSVAVVTISDWPRLTSGKTDYAALAALGRNAQRAAAEAARTSAGSSPLAGAFAPLLKGRAARPGDSFASLGGDSLAYVEVSMAIEAELDALPEGWERLPLAALESLRPAVPPARQTRVLSSDTVLRAAAVSTVVIGHIGDLTAVKGGGAVLLMIAGLNMARLQGARLATPQRWRVLGDFARRIVLPAYVMILFIAALSTSASLSLPTLLLVSNYFGENRGPLLPFWFVETLLQAVIVTIALFAVPSLRRFAVTRPYGFALGLLGLALMAKLVVPLLVTFAPLGGDIRTLDGWSYIFALGWLIAAATTRAEKLFCVALATLLAAWDWALLDPHTLWLAGAAAAILFVPRIRLWTPLAQGIAFLARISFHIYVTHMLAIQIVRWQLHLVSPGLALAGSIALGAGFYYAWGLVSRIASAVWQRLRPQNGLATASTTITMVASAGTSLSSRSERSA